MYNRTTSIRIFSKIIHAVGLFCGGKMIWIIEPFFGLERLVLGAWHRFPPVYRYNIIIISDSSFVWDKTLSTVQFFGFVGQISIVDTVIVRVN